MFTVLESLKKKKDILILLGNCQYQPRLLVGFTTANWLFTGSLEGDSGEVGAVDTNSVWSHADVNEVFLTFLYLESDIFTAFIPMLIRLARLLFLLPTSVIMVWSDIDDLLLLLAVLNFLVLSPITDLRNRDAFRFIFLRVDGFMANTQNIAIG